jgi:hypothetical protein
MTSQDFKELLVLEQKLYNKINEAIDLTHELAEAVSRQDQVSLRLLLSMRRKPLLELQEISSYIDLKRLDLNKTDAAEFDRLLSGSEPEHPEEVPVAHQIIQNRRLLGRLTELDHHISRSLCGEESYYRT